MQARTKQSGTDGGHVFDLILTQDNVRVKVNHKDDSYLVVFISKATYTTENCHLTVPLYATARSHGAAAFITS